MKKAKVSTTEPKPKEYIHCIPLTEIEATYLERKTSIDSDNVHITMEEAVALRRLAGKIRIAQRDAVMYHTHAVDGAVGERHNSMDTIRDAIKFIFDNDPDFKRSFAYNISRILMDRLGVKNKQKSDDVAETILKEFE